MQVGDFVRSNRDNYYGVIVSVDGFGYQVVWQGLSCKRAWEWPSDLVAGVENELMVFKGN